MEYNIYRLNDIKALSYQLPLKKTYIKKMIVKNGENVEDGFRRMIYVPGTNSYYLDDQKGEYTPEAIWFTNGEFRVRKDDTLLNSILKDHKYCGIFYKLWSEEGEISEKLASKKARAEARHLIEESGSDQMKAIALAVFGAGAFNWTKDKCELQLLDKADEDPQALKSVLSNKDYNARLLAGFAFVHNLVQENKNQTAVVWTDSDGVVLKLAKGENGINELGRFLATKTDDSELVLQAIGQKLEAIATFTGGKDTKEVLDEKDAEIARLKSLLANTEAEDPDLATARAKYEKVTGKDVPVNMKNNKEWLLKNTK